ncbi:MAG: HDIG domain-containing protein [Tannerellaceae bacterium]|jgi:uncharacterized protein|nr:HDIG domain-containing protein [Tannerellaceae bacterium]
MNPLEIIDLYYPEGTKRRHVLITHGQDVAEKALALAHRHPEMELDEAFIQEASLLHDIGMFLCDAADIDCYGKASYICHGYLGAELVRQAGYPRHALVCERHTGTGLTLSHIIEKRLPIPHRDMVPESLEEQLICFADKFFGKRHLGKEKSLDRVQAAVARHGRVGEERFERWCKLFL